MHHLLLCAADSHQTAVDQLGRLSQLLVSRGASGLHEAQSIVRQVLVKASEDLDLRALLERLSLFPLGCYVQMKDGRVGRVIRSNGKQYYRPVLELWEPRLTGPPEIVDLTASDLQVAKPLTNVPG
jgi:hypothetical protein